MTALPSHATCFAGPAVEVALCRAVLEPLKPALWTKLRTLRAQELRRLRRRQIALRVGAGPEGQSTALRNRIHARLAHLHAACAPRRKVALLLEVCSDVYAGLAVGENKGKKPLDLEWFNGGYQRPGKGSPLWCQAPTQAWEPDGRCRCAPLPNLCHVLWRP